MAARRLSNIQQLVSLLIVLSLSAAIAGCTSSQTIAPTESDSPTITSATTAEISSSAPFSYQIVATNSPTSYGASGLPADLNIDSSTGLISGSILDSRQVSIELQAHNMSGTGTTTLNLTPITSSNPAGSTNNCSPEAAPSSLAALTAGFTTMAFCDDFDSTSTIDTGGTGSAGYLWYPTLPFGDGRTSPSAYAVSNSVLTLTGNSGAWNWGLSTRDPETGNGNAWTFGYFEARVYFDPTLGPQSEGWPSFWAYSARQAQMITNDRWAELDFFEAVTGGGAGWTNYTGVFAGSLHDWQNAGAIDYMNSNAAQYPDADWTQWHVIGCLWVQGQVTWYLDGTPLMKQTYSNDSAPYPLADTVGGLTPTPTGVFNVLDTEPMGMQVIVGSSPGWPMHIDWVRVWEPPH
jgi:Glycosyl hydrolases family 16